MKKIVSLLMLLFVFVPAIFAEEGQWWIGGYFGYSYSKISINDESLTTCYIVPEFGYDVDDDWGIGFDFGYRLDNGTLYEIPVKDKIDTFGIKPFVRYNLFEEYGFTVYLKGTVFYESLKYRKYELSPDAYGISVVPVLSYMISKNCTISATINVLELSYVHMHCKEYELDEFDFNANSGTIANIGFNYYFDINLN